MTDPDLTDQERRVRDLLADARHTGPMPDGVAARLDGVLADLRAEDPSPTAAPVAAPADLSAARRGRRGRRAGLALVAAAAVVVAGLGISRIDVTPSADDAGASSMPAGDSAGDSAADGGAESGGDADSGADAPPSESLPQALASGSAVALTSAGFDRQVRRIVDTREAELDTSSRAASKEDLEDRLRDQVADGAYALCSFRLSGPGTPLPATYDGQWAVLVLRPRADGSRRADLYLCDDRSPARSTVVPAD